MSAMWIRSTYSDSQGGQCVEWAPGLTSGAGDVPVRDSKDTGRATLTFSLAAWAAFVEDVKRDER
ncbi:DUF397 domain-containing protein [Streptomyces reniochalinae]|uniref:DUF397 domain-containing protein n=1 Tax=Streptomyces reniochalinae TaxID=2250578 RepID=A0A367EAI3_9ACTN|nr:DUF397 domain-containing protein [Streptomyces reniochalinae]RCG15031.1 DUF397 domain-containing protein [Streptomyces reniochalinae]